MATLESHISWYQSKSVVSFQKKHSAISPPAFNSQPFVASRHFRKLLPLHSCHLPFLLLADGGLPTTNCLTLFLTIICFNKMVAFRKLSHLFSTTSWLLGSSRKTQPKMSFDINKDWVRSEKTMIVFSPPSPPSARGFQSSIPSLRFSYS